MLGCFSLFQRVTFLCLHKEQVTKRKCTPASACFLCYSACRAAIKNSLLRSSNSCLPSTPANPALLGASDGGPEHHATATAPKLNKEEKRIWFLNRPNLINVSLARIITFITLSSGDKVGVVGHRLFEFRGGLRSLQAARASSDGRPLC